MTLTPQQSQQQLEQKQREGDKPPLPTILLIEAREKDLTLKQTCCRESSAAQYAFKDSMIH